MGRFRRPHAGLFFHITGILTKGTLLKNTLVTGGAGMIGSNLVKSLIESGRNVYVIDNLWRGKLENLNVNGRPLIDLKRNFFQADLTVPGVIESTGIQFDEIFHLADVVAGIGYVFSNQLDIFRKNILINSNVVHSASKVKPAAFLYVGTACSFPKNLQDGSSDRPLIEEDQYPANPESAYGWSKLMGEYESFLLEKDHGIPVSVLSLHNVYGSPCDFDAEKSQVIPSLIRKAICYPSESFTVWGSGSQGRAFVHVNDVVAALVLAAENGLGKGVIQIGPDKATTIKEIAELIVKVSGKQIHIEFDTSKPEGDHSRCADFSKAQRTLDWSPKVKLEQGISELYAWVEEQLGSSIGKV